MPAVKKLTLGLMSENKSFRVNSLWGVVVDAILEARGSEIPETFYTQVAESSNNGFISLLNDKGGNSLLIDRQTVAFTKTSYPNGHVDVDEAIKEFLKVWNVVQKVIHFKGVRRIGIVAEHRIDPIKSNN